MKNSYALMSLLCIFVLASNCMGQKCKRFFQYSSTTIDIKGINTSLKKAGVEIANVGVGEIKIDPKYTIAVERLQQLDLAQFVICGQLKGLPRRSDLRMELVKKQVEQLIEIEKIAQSPETFSKQE